MPAHHSTPRVCDPHIAQRAIIHQLLRSDHTERWSPEQIARTLFDVTPEAIKDAILRLEANNAIYCVDEYIAASRCARYLFALDLICI